LYLPLPAIILAGLLILRPGEVAKTRKRREDRGSVALRLGQPALARARYFALLSSTAIVLAGLVSAPLRADDECGTGTSVICDAGDAAYALGPDGEEFTATTALRVAY
jgi:hypothetical protein